MAKAMARRTYFSPRRPSGPPHSVAPTPNNNHEGVGRASAMGIVEPGYIPGKRRLHHRRPTLAQLRICTEGVPQYAVRCTSREEQ